MTDHDDVLDPLLAALRADVPAMADTAFAGGRARLVTAIDTPTDTQTDWENPMTVTITPISQEVERPRKPRWGTLTAVAATVAALAAGAVFVTTTGTGDDAPVGSPNAIVVDLGNGHTITVDQPTLAPGQYRLEESHTWAISAGIGAVFRGEGFRDTWSPAEWTDEWQQTFRPGGIEVISGNEQDAAAARELAEKAEEVRGPCGQFGNYVDLDGNPDPPCDGDGWTAVEGSGGVGSPEFFAKLPTDPQALYEKIKENVGDSGVDPHLQALITGSGLLQPTAPPEVRATIFRALALIPGVQLKENVRNLDGQAGLAFIIDAKAVDQTYTRIVDPATGAVIGERKTDAGTESSNIATTWSVVDGIGVKPGN